MMNIVLYHNLLWSKYKARVFSEIQKLCLLEGTNFRVVQIAETDSSRVVLSAVDPAVHQYTYDLLLEGAYDSSGVIKRCVVVGADALKRTPSIALLPGYEKPEYWLMLLVYVVKRVPRAVFCDSTVNDRQQSKVKSAFKRLFFSMCDGFFCYGKRSKEYLMLHGAAERDIRFRCQAAYLPDSYSTEWVRSRRRETSLPNESALMRLLYVGRIAAEKGLHTLILAFRELLGRGTKAQLKLIGSGPVEAELKKLCVELGIESEVVFLGGMPFEAIADELVQAHLLVLPSSSEPWGLVVNEALAYGCPVAVSQACGCVPELVIPGVTGAAFETGSVESLLGAMVESLSLWGNPEKLVDGCLNTISSYSPKNAARQILDGCKEILEMK